MDNFKTERSTGRNIQTSIFLKSLRKQMDKMSGSLRKDEMIKLASAYKEDGFSQSEAEELLAIDGFDKGLVRAYFEKGSSNVPDGNMLRWGFDLEDSSGRIVTHEDLAMEIYAADEKEAMVKVSELTRQAGFDPEFENILGVYPVE